MEKEEWVNCIYKRYTSEVNIYCLLCVDDPRFKRKTNTALRLHTKLIVAFAYEFWRKNGRILAQIIYLK